MGSIYKRGNTYWIKYYRQGKPYRESTKSEKEADAQRLLKKREGEIADGKFPGVHFDRIRFDELAADFLAVQKGLPEYLRGFVTFAYKVGWRFTEISTLTWAQST